jgi:acetyl-CoA carboxylase biotin carboxyl carrier protein
MNYKEISDLIKLIGKSNLSEFKMEDGEFKLTIRTEKYAEGKTPKVVSAAPAMPVAPAVAQPVQQPAAPAQPSAPAAPADLPSTEKEEASEANYLEVRSPMVGTFYRSPSPDKAPFFKVGDMVNAGDVVCIVEAMKLFNEIESEVSGKIVKVLVEDAQPVEYDQVLFLLDPKG